MLLSVMFIIVTLLVYGCIPKLRSLYGKCLLCYLIQLAIAYTFVSALQLNGYNYIQKWLCYSIAYVVYFAFLSAFLWLNVLNFDFWLNFQWAYRNCAYHLHEAVIHYNYYFVIDQRVGSRSFRTRNDFSSIWLMAMEYHAF